MLSARQALTAASSMSAWAIQFPRQLSLTEIGGHLRDLLLAQTSQFNGAPTELRRGGRGIWTSFQQRPWSPQVRCPSTRGKLMSSPSPPTCGPSPNARTAPVGPSAQNDAARDRQICVSLSRPTEPCAIGTRVRSSIPITAAAQRSRSAASPPAARDDPRTLRSSVRRLACMGTVQDGWAPVLGGAD
jgi:hypothetical protein